MSKKICFLFVAIFFSSYTFVSTALAGLVNYQRRNGVASKAAASKGDPAPIVAKWMSVLPLAQSATEKKYDVNVDGKLQTAEVKIFLRDVINVVDAKGGYAVDSDILKEYDKNKDGVINRYEVAIIKEHAK